MSCLLIGCSRLIVDAIEAPIEGVSSSTAKMSAAAPMPYPSETWAPLLRRMIVQLAAVWVGIGVLLNAIWLIWHKRNRPAAVEPPTTPQLPAGFRERTIRANGCSFHVVEAGSQDPKAPLLLLLHGFPEHWYCWRHVMAALANGGHAPTSGGPATGGRGMPAAAKGMTRFRIVAPDLRGCGHSESNPSWPFTAYSIPVLVEDVRALIVALGYSSACVVGHDWGGLLAWCFAAAHPGFVSRMAVLAAPHPRAFQASLSLSQVSKSWYGLFFQLPMMPEWYMNLCDQHFVRAVYRGRKLGLKRTGDSEGMAMMTEADIDANKAALALPGTSNAAVNYYRNVFGMNVEPAYRHFARSSSASKPLTMPVLHLWADKDGALDLTATAATGRYCTDYRLVVINNCSHWIQQDAIKETVEHLSEFFGRAFETNQM